MLLKNKTAIVTGASRGIGHATALALGQQGAHVIAIARTVGGLEELDDAIQSAGGSATLVPLDITDTPKLQALGPSLIGRFPQIDIVVGAAGYLSKLTSIAQGPMDHWTRAMATNATANLVLLQTLYPLLKKSTQAQIVFPVHSELPADAYWGFYSASKEALRALALAFAQENPSIDVQLCDLPFTQTRLYDEAFPGKPADFTTEQAAQKILNTLLQTQKKAA